MGIRRRTSLAAALAAAAVLLGSQALGGAGQRLITETDLLRFVWIADPQISPDGGQVAFVRVTVNEERDRYETALWMVATDGSSPPRPFTAGPHDTAPRWSPDGRTLAFLRAAERDGRTEPPQIHLISAAGGEARALTQLPRGVGELVWSPDGRRIAFTTTTTAEDLARAKETTTGGRPGGRTSDVRVVTRAVYRFNGRGYLDPTRPAHIWTVAVPEPGQPLPEPTPLTSGEFDETNVAWTPDGSRLLFTSDRVAESYYFPSDRDLYAVPAAGGEPERVASIDGVIGNYAVSPDGRRIGFVGTLNGERERSYDQPDLFVVDLAPGASPRNLTVRYDRDIGSGLTGDQRAPRGSLPTAPVWSSDGRSLLVVASDQGRANLVRVDVASGTVAPATTGDHEVVAYTAARQGGAVVALVSTPTNIGDLFLLRSDTAGPARLVRLTSVNEALAQEWRLSEVEEFWYPSFDGRRIQAWIQKPPDFDPTRRYPLILQIHGGPHAAYGYTFVHEFQWMAARGYVVLFTNPRGSSSYGQQFGNIIQYRYPGDDYRDLMAGVDEALKRPYIDPKRLGVTGGSGGGLLTNWVVTQTDRFAAAVSQRSIADWAHFWYTADFALFTPFWFRRPPWEDPDEYRQRSPIAYVDRVKTPLMLIEGEEDYRTPPGAGGEQMFRALKYRKVPTVMVRFPGETHDLSRSGAPSHRIERLRHIVGWFDKYLLGRQTDP
jgi:dipeptidyl aminopeptidase/acylaminoacyl peptidase